LTRTIVALAFTLLVAACGGGAKEMLETAEFEELQRNTTHARELYQEILRKHPNAPEATKAKERLAALDAGPPN
jgi:TolA-binding protein